MIGTDSYTMHPFNHECQWRGPFYMWASNQVDAEPPKDCKPVYACGICGAQRPAHDATKESFPNG